MHSWQMTPMLFPRYSLELQATSCLNYADYEDDDGDDDCLSQKSIFPYSRDFVVSSVFKSI